MKKKVRRYSSKRHAKGLKRCGKNLRTKKSKKLKKAIDKMKKS